MTPEKEEARPGFSPASAPQKCDFSGSKIGDRHYTKSGSALQAGWPRGVGAGKRAKDPWRKLASLWSSTRGTGEALLLALDDSALWSPSQPQRCEMAFDGFFNNDGLFIEDARPLIEIKPTARILARARLTSRRRPRLDSRARSAAIATIVACDGWTFTGIARGASAAALLRRQPGSEINIIAGSAVRSGGAWWGLMIGAKQPLK
jgi:hypothetical protein